MLFMLEARGPLVPYMLEAEGGVLVKRYNYLLDMVQYGWNIINKDTGMSLLLVSVDVRFGLRNRKGHWLQQC